MCVVGACGACGFSMAAGYRAMEHSLRQLKNGLELMQCQMEYRLTELPELCSILSSACAGPVGRFFDRLGQELRTGENPDVPACMALTLAKTEALPAPCPEILRQLGNTLGQLDLSGQRKGLASAREAVDRALRQIEAEKASRLRCYRALGLCGGAALAILLL